MDIQLTHIFGQVLRKNAAGDILTPDGRALSANSPAFALAEKLLDLDAELYADEIVKLLTPLCLPFDREKIRKSLIALGKKQGKKQESAETSPAQAAQMRQMS